MNKTVHLEAKNRQDVEMIQLYKKQIAQLAACIKDRECRIERRQKVIYTVSEREASQFASSLSSAKTRGDMLLDTDYHHKAGKSRAILTGGKYVLVTNNMPEFGSSDLRLLSEMFFTENPEAKVFLQADDK